MIGGELRWLYAWWVEKQEKWMAEAERFLIRMIGGPHPGTRILNDPTPPSVTETWTWPLPDELAGEGGAYRKVSESQLPPMPGASRVLRGAQYHWVVKSDG